MKKISFIFLFLITIITLDNFTKEQKVLSKKKIWVESSLYDASLNKKNPDIIGKIEIKNTSINYDIVKTTNNEYYLTHDANKNKSKYGAIFLDYRNHLTDQKLLIYGHNSEIEDAPFKDLEKYLNKEFYETSKDIIIKLNDEQYIYQIFSIMITKVGDYKHTKIKFTPEEYQKHLTWLKNSSLYNTNVNVTNSDSIITLQTCYYQPKKSFLLINAKRRTK